MKPEKERRGTDNLFAIKGVDFSKPWPSVVPQVNIVLKANRYETLKEDVPYHFIVSNLDSTSIKEGGKFDSLRVHYNLLNEDFDPKLQAVARLGLQAVYWKKLYDGLHPVKYISGFRHDNWQDFSCIPVFVKGGTPHLNIEPDSTSASGIQYGGDGDMISYAEKRAMDVGEKDKVPFRGIGVLNESLDQYVELRKKMKQAENRAQIKAISKLKQNHDVWNRLRLIAPGVDDVFADDHILGTHGGDRQLNFMFLPQAHELVMQKYGMDQNASIPEYIKIFFLHSVAELAELLYFLTRKDYSRELYFDEEFNHSLLRLGKLMDGMYEDALNTMKDEGLINVN